MNPWPHPRPLVCGLVLVVGSTVLLGGVFPGAFLLPTSFNVLLGDGALVGAGLSWVLALVLFGSSCSPLMGHTGHTGHTCGVGKGMGKGIGGQLEGVFL